MANNYYQAHASKLVERERGFIEVSLNNTFFQNLYIYLAVAFVAICALILSIYISFFAAVIGAGVSVTMAIILFFFLPAYAPEYGVWKVTCDRGKFAKGDTVKFRCERFVEGEVVESITRG